MNILVVSDSHGAVEKLYSIYEKYKGSIDLVIHLGDGIDDLYGLNIENYLAVKGNNDFHIDEHYVASKEIDNMLFVFEHIPNKSYVTIEDYETKNIVYMHGHEHKIKCNEYDKLIELSPGAILMPRDGNLPSYMIIKTELNKLDVEIIDIKDKILRKCKKSFN